MEIIARLREEREALVARIAQIDKMLQQYDEWGREAQRLLSMTGAVRADSVDALGATEAPVDASSGGSDQAASRKFPNIRIRTRTSFPTASVQSKTPMPEFEAAVVQILRDASAPMDRVALYEALTQRGIVIGSGGRDKDLNALSARVYRMAQDPKNRISGERGQGYWLVTDEEDPESDSVEGGDVDDEGIDPLA